MSLAFTDKGFADCLFRAATAFNSELPLFAIARQFFLAIPAADKIPQRHLEVKVIIAFSSYRFVFEV